MKPITRYIVISIFLLLIMNGKAYAQLIGDNLSNPINAGTYDNSFSYSDTKHPDNFTNQNLHWPGRDIFYKFTINTMMDVTITHCGSESRYTYLYLLDSSGGTITFINYGCPTNRDQSHLQIADLAAGTYYVVSEGGLYINYNITTQISGLVTVFPGDTRATAINVGTHNSYFQYTDSRDTKLYSNQFRGQATNDVFYKFTLTKTMDIAILLCVSSVNDTYTYLLNSSGTVIASYNYTYPICCCEVGGPRYLLVSSLAPGTYYVVSEGASQNGKIHTEIIGKDPALPGDNREVAINAGTHSSSFSYTDTKDNRLYSNQHPGKPTYDIFYKFTTTTQMNVTISHCGSEVRDTYFHLLDASGNTILFDDNNSSECSVRTQSHLTITDLAPGTYYVVTEGATVGNLTTTISGIIPVPPGDTRADAIDAGTYHTEFSYTDTKNTGSYTNQYSGRSTNDVFYKFVTTIPMDVTISHCGSGVSDTYLHLLDASGNRIAYNDNNASGCANSAQSYLTMANLSPGTYYVVSEGYNQNGNITTTVTGTIPIPPSPGDSRTTAIDAGTYNTRFSYTDTRNTAGPGYTNQYNGQSTNDVFYTFIVTQSMDITISHCGSEVSNTYLHLLDASGNRIGYNDDNTSGCPNSAQAYLQKNNLAPGTYYVVSEGYSQNGNITTMITGNIGIEEPTDPVISPPAISVSANQNFILTKIARAATVSSASLTTANSMQTVQYFDGLGRPVETIHIGASPERKDIITYQEYDAFGRDSISWLPADFSGTNGSFRPLSTIQSTTPAAYGNDSRAFSEIRYERSPLSRVDKMYGPGQAWSTHPVGTEYAANTSSGDLSCVYYYLSGDNPVKSGNYPAGQLYVVKTTNEDGHVSYDFTDKLGRTVLQRQINEGSSANHDTYYIYDDYSNLRYVLPPMAADASNLTDAINKYAYVYKYDDRNRCIEKKLPGADAIYYVYDKSDRLILSQDGVQRSSSEWTFYKYDPFGRLILSGILTDRSNRATLANTYKNSLITESRGTAVMGYTNTSSLYITVSQVLLANYYDNYSWTGTSALQQSTSNTPSGYDQPHSSAQGLLAGTAVRTLNGTDQLLYTSFFYDYRGNLVGKHAQNIFSGYEHEYYAYNFAGEMEKKLLKHCNSVNSEILSEAYTYEYDHAGRMKKKYYALNGNASIQMASYRYDNVGRLLTKYTGGLELSSYAYNIRGWMTNLSGQRFSENMVYKKGGNISELLWYTDNQDGQVYSFTYDKLDRMKQAAYSGREGRNYTESLTYDKHGNPLTITRYGRIQNGASYAYGPIDNLTMSSNSYHGNRLIGISESVNNQLDYDLMEFKKSSASSPHYTYDTNGNLTKDSHKNISSIQYNYLNLPKQVTFGDGKTIAYTHDASGVKHEVTYYNPALNPVTSKTNYISNKIYEDGTLSMVLTEEGYLKKQGSNYVPFYYLKDHLGSNRIVIDGTSGGVVQATNHYPFGMSFADAPQRDDQSVQRYKYTGKELDREHGLNLYDYHARMYDPAIGRFTTMDPLAEKYYSISPYAYCNNNPVIRVDKDGREWTYVVGANGHTTINVALNFSISGNYTATQIQAYKNAIITQFHNTIFKSSGGIMSGTVTFHNENSNIVQSLSLGKLNNNIGGLNTYFGSSVNLLNSEGELKSFTDVGLDATHEILHTLRLEHPFEVTQTSDTKLLRVAPNSFVSTSTTDKNIVNNIMSYPMITIDGMKSSNQNSLTKGQLNLMLDEINLQNQGYGFIPKYNSTLTREQNEDLYKKYYENYWLNTPGTPVGNQ